MIIKCTEEEKERMKSLCIDNIFGKAMPCNYRTCEECFEKHNITFEIVEDK